MVTATSFLTALPPASLAAADFPRFITRTLGRCSREELAPLLSLLEAQTLSGYPASLAPVLRLSETPPRWARPTVPLGYHEPAWPAHGA